MSSTNKTDLGFNQWVLSDKPTMHDYNADNQLADELIGALEEKLEGKLDSDGANMISGSWNPVFMGLTTPCEFAYLFQDSYYYCIGQLVYVYAQLHVGSVVTPASGILAIGTLPFQPKTATSMSLSTTGAAHFPVGDGATDIITTLQGSNSAIAFYSSGLNRYRIETSAAGVVPGTVIAVSGFYVKE